MHCSGFQERIEEVCKLPRRAVRRLLKFLWKESRIVIRALLLRLRRTPILSSRSLMFQMVELFLLRLIQLPPYLPLNVLDDWAIPSIINFFGYVPSISYRYLLVFCPIHTEFGIRDILKCPWYRNAIYFSWDNITYLGKNFSRDNNHNIQ